MSQILDFPSPAGGRIVGSEVATMSYTAALPANVVVLHPDIPRLSRQDRARLDMIDLLRDLDADSQRVVVDQLLASHARVRRYTPAGALLRGERGPVAWRAGAGPRWLVAPSSRRWLYQRARA
jgi:hypothetical protein